MEVERRFAVVSSCRASSYGRGLVIRQPFTAPRPAARSNNGNQASEKTRSSAQIVAPNHARRAWYIPSPYSITIRNDGLVNVATGFHPVQPDRVDLCSPPIYSSQSSDHAGIHRLRVGQPSGSLADHPTNREAFGDPGSTVVLPGRAFVHDLLGRRIRGRPRLMMMGVGFNFEQRHGRYLLEGGGVRENTRSAPTIPEQRTASLAFRRTNSSIGTWKRNGNGFGKLPPGRPNRFSHAAADGAERRSVELRGGDCNWKSRQDPWQPNLPQPIAAPISRLR